MARSTPGETLSPFDAVLIIVGVVVGVGIFKTPSLVAASAGSGEGVVLLWLAGGAISLIGALCYAELTSAYPHPGGDYHYLHRAYGRVPAFLFAWARLSVIQTGSLAMTGFLIGDYASEVLRLGRFSSSLYAAAAVVLLTLVNAAGIEQGKWVQRTLVGGLMLGLAAMAAAGVFFVRPPPLAVSLPGKVELGRAMIFVLLTYGGWNEAAYLSAEVRGGGRRMAPVLVTGIAAITAIYLLINGVLVSRLGVAGMAGSEVVAADLMGLALGANGARFMSLLIVLAALSTMNAVIITGARTTYALGLDFPRVAFLGRWRARGGTPVNALLVQGGAALLLVLAGTAARSGFVMMVEYTAPVFWLFLLLTAGSLFILRRRDRDRVRPFRVPLYPLTPLLFCSICLYMLRASLAYTGGGALLGVGVLLAGMLLLLGGNRQIQTEQEVQR